MSLKNVFVNKSLNTGYTILMTILKLLKPKAINFNKAFMGEGILSRIKTWINMFC